jgi:mutator protein MutT
MGEERPVLVGIGLVRRGDRFLVRQRPPGVALAGLWEFPGGKCEPGESSDAATRRECREELGVDIALGTLRRVVTQRYPHALVELYYYDCSTADAGAEPAPGSGFRWVRASDLPTLAFPEANGPVVDSLVREFADGEAPDPG